MAKIFLLLLLATTPAFCEPTSWIGNTPSVAVPIVVETERPGENWNCTAVLLSSKTLTTEYLFLGTARHCIDGSYLGAGKGFAVKLSFFMNRNLNQADTNRGELQVQQFEMKISTTFPSNVVFPSNRQSDVAVVFLNKKPLVDQEKVVAEASKYSSAQSTATAVWPAHPFLPADNIEQISSGPNNEQLNDVFFVGFPYGFNLKVWMRPLIRKAIIASPSTDGYSIHDYGPNAFIIDNSPIGGDSGGPIFMRKYVNDLAWSWVLVGIISQELTHAEQYSISGRYRDESRRDKQRLNLGLGWRATELLDPIQKLMLNN